MITVIANLKGGTGKSTVNFNLAVWLVRGRRDVQLIDLDPQRTLSDVIDVRQEEEYQPALSVEHDLSSVNNSEDCEVLIDVGISDMDALNEAIKVTDRLLIPVPPSQADVWSTQRFLKMVRQVCEESSRDLPEILGFINRADTHPAVRETDETIEALGMLSDIKLLRPKLYQRTDYRRSFSEGMAVFELRAGGKAAYEIHRLATELYP